MDDASRSRDPLFTIEHSLEIAGRPEEVWSALADFENYAEWNPYVLAISGDAVVGGLLEVSILQTNWPEPISIQPTIFSIDAPSVLHWRGRVGDGGLLDTDHSFHIEPLTRETVRFVQREEFRGSLAKGMDDAARQFTHDAFKAMNEALADRVRSRRAD